MRAPNQHETALFDSLCGRASVDEIESLRTSVARHGEELRLAARQQELLPVDLSDALTRRIDTALAEYAALPPDAQRLVVGAARYFVSDADAIPDKSGVLGLDDDVAIWNLVVRRIDRPDLEIDE